MLTEPGAVDASGLAPAPAQGFTLPSMAGAQLAQNPQLPQHPLGAYTDSMYEAQLAQLKATIAKQYNDVLQQLGYTNDQGQFVPGQVEIDANRQRSELGRNIQLADEGVTQQAQQQGTLFSGLRGTAQARAEYPFQSAISDLGVSVPKQLTSLYGQGTDLISQYNTQQNLLLAEAAQRAAANATNNASAGGNITGVPDQAAAPPVDNTPAPAAPAAAPPAAYTDVGGGAVPVSTVGQVTPGGIVNDPGGYYDPMTGQYHLAGTGPAAGAVKPKAPVQKLYGTYAPNSNLGR
jgi:hypothetical protein